MSILYLFHHRLDLGRLGHVAFDHQRVLQLIRHIGRIRLVLALGVGHIIYDTVCPACAESLDHLRPNAARELPVTRTTLPVKSNGSFI